MRIRLTGEQLAQAIRQYLEDPDEGVVAVRIPPEHPIRISVARNGTYNIYTAEDAELKPRKIKAVQGTNSLS